MDGKGLNHPNQPDTGIWQVRSGTCPYCGQSVRLKKYDKFLRCHRCHNYLAGTPILRWVTHPTWILYYYKNPKLAARDIVRLAILSVVIVGIFSYSGMVELNTESSSSVGLPSFLGNISTSVEQPADVESGFNRTKTERLVWQYTNKKRVERGLSRVEYAPRIVKPARDHSRNMAKHDYVGHTEPNGETGEERYSEFCNYRGSGYSFGENVFGAWYEREFTSWKTNNRKYLSNEDELARYLVNGWMASEGHRENILNPSWSELGVGIYKTDEGEVFASQTFC